MSFTKAITGTLDIMMGNITDLISVTGKIADKLIETNHRLEALEKSLKKELCNCATCKNYDGAKLVDSRCKRGWFDEFKKEHPEVEGQQPTTHRSSGAPKSTMGGVNCADIDYHRASKLARGVGIRTRNTMVIEIEESDDKGKRNK